MLAIVWLGFFVPVFGQTHIRPYAPPNVPKPADVKKNKLQASLRFGYLRDNKKAESLRQRIEYNAEGLPLMTYEFGDQNQIVAKSIFEYDDSNVQLATATIEKFTGDNELVLSLFYRFAPDGRLLEYREVNEKEQMRRMGCSYNSSDQILVKQFFEADGLPGASEVYGYDEKGNQVSMEKFDIAGDLVSKTISNYDLVGRVISKEEFLKNDFLLYTTKYFYDEKGRLTKSKKLGRSGDEIQIESWKYNSLGLCFEHKVKERDDENPLREVYKYDSKKRKTEQIVYNPNGKIFQWFKYMHDSTGSGAGFERLLPDGKTDYKLNEKYNSNGQLIEQTELYPDGTGDKHRTFKYDANGLLMEEKHLDYGEEEFVYWFVYEKS